MIRRIMDEYVDQRFLKFFISGGLAAMVNLASRFTLDMFMPYAPAIVLGYILGMFAAFGLYKLFVFEAQTSHRTPREIFWFLMVNVAALLQTLLISIILSKALPRMGWTYRPHDVAHVVGVGVPVFTSYLGHKYFSFAKA